MAYNSDIEWTDTTWNPATGCTKVSSGCRFCYAERFAERFRGTPGHPFEQGFDLKLHPDRLQWPYSWKKSRLVFVNSMSDLFHEKIDSGFIERVFLVMEENPRHTFQVLTKRPQRMLEFCADREIAPNIRLGVSVETGEFLWRIEVHLEAFLDEVFGSRDDATARRGGYSVCVLAGTRGYRPGSGLDSFSMKSEKWAGTDGKHSVHGSLQMKFAHVTNP